jgi:hypothetical protein
MKDLIGIAITLGVVIVGSIIIARTDTLDKVKNVSTYTDVRGGMR